MRAIYYHGVVDGSASSDYYARNFIGVRQFRQHVDELARHWHVVSLAELSAHVTGGERLPPRSVHISFDDGFANTLLGAEILAEARLPWTLFAITDAVLHRYRPVYIRLADAISACAQVIHGDGVSYDLRTGEGKWAFARRAKAELMSVPAADEERMLAAVLSLLGRKEPVAEEDSHWQFMNASDLIDLQRSGVAIGNHSRRHRNLVRCSTADLVHEVHDSKLELEAAIGAPVSTFAYPDGRRSRRVAAQVARHHELAMATWTSRSALAPMAVRRHSAGRRLEDLEEVLRSDYPACCRLRRARWALRPLLLEHALRLRLARRHLAGERQPAALDR